MKIVIKDIGCNHTQLYADGVVVATHLDSCDVVVDVISNCEEIECKFNLTRDAIVMYNGIPDYEQSIRNHLHKAFIELAAE